MNERCTFEYAFEQMGARDRLQRALACAWLVLNGWRLGGWICGKCFTQNALERAWCWRCETNGNVLREYPRQESRGQAK